MSFNPRRRWSTCCSPGDALKALLERHQGTGADAPDTTGLKHTIRMLCDGGQVDTVGGPAAAPAAGARSSGRGRRQPGARNHRRRAGRPGLADSLVELFDEIAGLGRIEPLDAGRAADGMRRFKVITTSSDNDLLDLFTFHVPREALSLQPIGPGYGFYPGAPGAPKAEPRLAVTRATASSRRPAPRAPWRTPSAARRPTTRPTPAPRPARRVPGRTAAAPESATLRVSVEKVDQLINLVGELVITQAMLAQNSKTLDVGLNQQMSAGLADLERNTRDLQEAVMSIRMIPMAMIFNRFPRMLRDLRPSWARRSSW